jgi:hypothetical protein
LALEMRSSIPSMVLDINLNNIYLLTSQYLQFCVA